MGKTRGVLLIHPLFYQMIVHHEEHEGHEGYNKVLKRVGSRAFEPELNIQLTRQFAALFNTRLMRFSD